MMRVRFFTLPFSGRCVFMTYDHVWTPRRFKYTLTEASHAMVIWKFWCEIDVRDREQTNDQHTSSVESDGSSTEF